MKRSFLQTILLILLVATLLGCSKPDLYDSNGKGITLKDDSGKWLALNIWAEWCDSCREEIPDLNALARSGTLRVLGYDFDNSQGDELNLKITQLGIQFPIVTSNPLALLNTTVPQMLPATLIIDGEGELVEVLYGPQTEAGVNEKLQELQLRAEGSNG